MYPRVDYPEKEYSRSDIPCPFEFDIPVYSELVPYAGDHECWYNLHYTPFKATLHLSYKPMNGISSLDSFMEDAHQLAFKHISKAEDIVPSEFSDSSGNYGMFYDLYGKTATPFNFFITDKENHFLRGSFYFDTKTDLDSVAPIYEFLKKDIFRSIETFRWK